jgi:hypothetical protein
VTCKAKCFCHMTQQRHKVVRLVDGVPGAALGYWAAVPKPDAIKPLAASMSIMPCVLPEDPACPKPVERQKPIMLCVSIMPCGRRTDQDPQNPRAGSNNSNHASHVSWAIHFGKKPTCWQAVKRQNFVVFPVLVRPVSFQKKLGC